MNKPQPQTGPEIEEYSTTATPKAYAGSVPVFCAHDAIVPLKDLRPNPKNPNQHPPEQIKLLASIIRATGWRAPITVSKRSGLVTKGHGRLMAAQLDDLTDAPVDYQDYASEAEELADAGKGSKLNATRAFLHELRDLGRARAARWIRQHRADVGRRETVDVAEVFA